MTCVSLGFKNEGNVCSFKCRRPLELTSKPHASCVSSRSWPNSCPAMPITSSSWVSAGLQRYRPAVYVIAACAAGLAIYYANEALRSHRPDAKELGGLRRSNAVRRTRRTSRSQGDHVRRSSRTPLPSIDFLRDQAEIERTYVIYRFSNGEARHHLALSLYNLSFSEGGAEHIDNPETRRQAEEVFLLFYFYRHLNNHALSREQLDIILGLLSGFQLERGNIYEALNQHLAGRLRTCVETWIRGEIVAGRQVDDFILDAQVHREWTASHRDWTYSVTEAESVIEGDEPVQEEGEGVRSNLAELLYHIAENQVQSEGFVHRGIGCNGCYTFPIKGIRYRCTNCVDYDLCEACEAQQFHDKTHLFYKVRIPRSHLGHQPQKVKYPGGRLSTSLRQDMIDDFVERTGFSNGEIRGLWEQFKCTAAAVYVDDPLGFQVAIDRRGFEQLFISTDSTRPPPPNIVYDRIFSMYDTDKNDLIGFEELIQCLSRLQKRGPKEKWRRVFTVLDIDADGYVSRKDCLRIFQGHYALTKATTTEIIAYGDQDDADDELVASAQPLSSAFVDPISPGTQSRAGEGKTLDLHGDSIPSDSRGVVDHRTGDPPDIEEIVAQRAEERVFAAGAADFVNKSVREIVYAILHDPWPPSFVSEVHVKAIVHDNTVSATAEVTDPHSIEDATTQMYIRRMCQQDWATRWMQRYFQRCQAVKERRRRQTLLNDTCTPDQENEEPKLVKSTDPGSAASWSEDTIKEHEIFMSELDNLILDKYRFFPVAENFTLSLLQLILNGWETHDIFESLKGFSPNDNDILAFIADLLGLAERLLPGIEDSVKGPEFGVADDRFRSSSRLRFHDGLTSIDGDNTRSINITSFRSLVPNERWDSLGIPEPEEDVGRETMYQVLQEAFNEVLDPIFKTREDLWLDAQAFRLEFNTYRSVICKAVEEPRLLYDALQSFLKQCHMKADYPVGWDRWRTNGRSDAVIFAKFLKRTMRGSKDNLTYEMCLKCESHTVPIGKHCVLCGTGSLIQRRCSKSKSLRTEICEVCAKDGKLSRIQEADYCRRCHHPSVDRARTEEWLWTVLTDDVDLGRLYLAKARAAHLRSVYAGLRDEPKKKIIGKQDPVDRDTTMAALGANAEPSDLDSPQLSLGDTNMGEGSSNQPVTPRSDDTQPLLTSANVEDAMKRSLTENPEAGRGFEVSLKVWDESIKATFEKLNKKSSEQLLQESTPTECSQPVAEPVIRDMGTYHDLTLPQHRPNTISEADALLNEESNEKKSREQPDADKLNFWAALMILEAQDEIRGGPGRISEEEFLDIMTNERGKELEFMGDFLAVTAL